jgi:hypothetical protein
MSSRSIHNTVSDVLQQLEYTNILRDNVRVSDTDIRFTYVTIHYARAPERFFVAEVFRADDGDVSAMIMENQNFNTHIMKIFMDTLLDVLAPEDPVTDGRF